MNTRDPVLAQLGMRPGRLAGYKDTSIRLVSLLPFHWLSLFIFKHLLQRAPYVFTQSAQCTSWCWHPPRVADNDSPLPWVNMLYAFDPW